MMWIFSVGAVGIVWLSFLEIVAGDVSDGHDEVGNHFLSCFDYHRWALGEDDLVSEAGLQIHLSSSSCDLRAIWKVKFEWVFFFIFCLGQGK